MESVTEQRPDGSVRDLLLAFALVVVVNTLGASPAVLFSSDTSWIDRPWFFPPEVAFPIVWTLLFTLLGVALFLVVRRGLERRDVRVAIAAFAGQFALNLAWTPAFFGLQRPDLGLVVIVALWAAIVATIVAFDRVDRRAAVLLVPYLAWVSFAAVLNYAIYAGV
ncbi:TspO protein [Halobiforma lacisalsi AJ5]|uniref:TspO and MBR like protein n=1 Tax=Natronobacterium lacisalsi AJ5 TaxID=358396 RepID=M0LXB2_NATLA|nr:TspO/MBR family protein [Halobiforma lacisalsi]APW97639.1 TspO protein [Halobiforma lacisalsi AJ5]EMA36974.1 TspO and MBR like protein [Halobiforma lacisalsi AJ5]